MTGAVCLQKMLSGEGPLLTGQSKMPPLYPLRPCWLWGCAVHSGDRAHTVSQDVVPTHPKQGTRQRGWELLWARAQGSAVEMDAHEEMDEKVKRTVV